MSNKGFVPILIILLLIVLGFAGFLVFQNQAKVSNYQTILPSPSIASIPNGTQKIQPQSTATISANFLSRYIGNESYITYIRQEEILPAEKIQDWKTFINSIYKYSFKFPENKYMYTKNDNAGLSQYDDRVAGDYVQLCPSKKPQDCAQPSNFFGVDYYKNIDNLTLENWIITSTYSPMKQTLCLLNDPRTEIHKKIFLGHSAIIYKFFIDEEAANGVCKGQPFEGGGEVQGVILNRDNNIVNLYRVVSSEDARLELDTIFSTFKFTN